MVSSFPLFAAILSGFCFTLLGILLKRNTTATQSPFILPSWLALLFPVWCVLFIGTQATHTLTFNLSSSALIWPAIWAICTVSTTTILVWLLQSLSLTEVAGYKKALLTLMASAADIFIFHTAFPIITISALICLLCGSLLLGHARHKLPNKKQALALIAWCTILTLQITAYKQGQMHQTAILSHTILAQSMSTFLYTLLWLTPSVRNTPFKLLPALPLLAVAFTGVMIEGFAYAALPLAVVILVTMSGAALFAIHDLYTRELPRTRRSYIALTAIAAGFLLLIFK